MSCELDQAMWDAIKGFVRAGKSNIEENSGNTPVVETSPKITPYSSLASRIERAKYADRCMRQLVQQQLPSNEAGQVTSNASRTDQSLLVKFDSTQEAIREIDKLLADIQSDCPVKTITSGMSKKDQEEARTSNLRLDRTVDILDKMKQELQMPVFYPAKGATVFASYKQDGKPVGFLSMTQEPQQPYLACMATHPGTKGEGKKLAECAVQQSEEWGCNGRLKAILSNATIKKIAAAWGAKISGGEMIFDPNESEIWTRDNGEWKMKKDLNPSIAN